VDEGQSQQMIVRPKERLAPSRVNLGKHGRHRPAERRDLAIGIKADLAEQIYDPVCRRVGINGCVRGLIGHTAFLPVRGCALVKPLNSTSLPRRPGAHHLAAMCSGLALFRAATAAHRHDRNLGWVLHPLLFAG
jgi:hypothetical protein